MNIPIITVYTDTESAQGLIQSATKHGWDVIGLKVEEWKGFGTKIITVYEYLVEHPEISHFLFCDAYDVIIQESPKAFEEKVYYMPKDNPFFLDRMIFSAEKNCWPDASLAEDYPKSPTEFRYLNSGLYFAPVNKWLYMIKSFMPKYSDDDQLYFTKRFLGGYGWHIELDVLQGIFNSHSFISEGEYHYSKDKLRITPKIKINGEGEIFSNVLQTPTAIHLNGRTVDEKLNQMLGI